MFRCLRFFPLPFLAATFLAGLVAGAAPVTNNPAPARNLFAELLGRTPAQTGAKIATAWQQLFYGTDDNQRVFFPVADGTAYIADIANHDVRTEGLSYGMMICVQLDHRAEFDRIWKWARLHLRHPTGPLEGFLAWHADLAGHPLDPGPAPDGEEWIVTALFFASHRWGSTGAIDYETDAQELLRAMLHRPDESGADRIRGLFDQASGEIVFSPRGEGTRFTDPSYHLPAFYELWARWAAGPEDRTFCAQAAVTSRAFFKNAANPATGLMPDYANFDGTPHVLRNHENFLFDAWRTLSNPALDYAWFAADPWAVAQSNRVLKFLAAQGPICPNQFKLDGTPLSSQGSTGLTAMAATAGLAADAGVARPFVRQLWDMPIPEGKYRYYDGLLYLLALLEAGGRFQIYAPSPRL